MAIIRRLPCCSVPLLLIASVWCISGTMPAVAQPQPPPVEVYIGGSERAQVGLSDRDLPPHMPRSPDVRGQVTHTVRHVARDYYCGARSLTHTCAHAAGADSSHRIGMHRSSIICRARALFHVVIIDLSWPHSVYADRRFPHCSWIVPFATGASWLVPALKAESLALHSCLAWGATNLVFRRHGGL